MLGPESERLLRRVRRPPRLPSLVLSDFAHWCALIFWSYRVRCQVGLLIKIINKSSHRTIEEPSRGYCKSSEEFFSVTFPFSYNFKECGYLGVWKLSVLFFAHNLFSDHGLFTLSVSSAICEPEDRSRHFCPASPESITFSADHAKDGIAYGGVGGSMSWHSLPGGPFNSRYPEAQTGATLPNPAILFLEIYSNKLNRCLA